MKALHHTAQGAHSMNKIKCLVEGIGSINNNRVTVIKMIRTVTGMGLQDSKHWVDRMVPTGPYQFNQRFLLTEAQFGRLAAFLLGMEVPIAYIKEVEVVRDVGVDFTHLTS
jgi:hypothetical protein